MNREILFRAKCIDETCLKGEWLEGDILHDGVTGRYYINKNSCLNESDIISEKGLLRFVAYEVDPETVCQYTGLTDKNGRKIFEGDIVKDDFVQLKGAIKFSERYLQFVVDDVHDGEQDYSEFMQKVEVIGNIFDNPELIGK